MSATPLLLLLAAACTAALGGAALHTTRGLRRQLAELRGQLAAADARAAVPSARTPMAAEEVRAAVAQALAEERERELAEARAYWAAQEAREAQAEGAAPEAHGTGYAAPGLDEALFDMPHDHGLDDGRGDADGRRAAGDEAGPESPELAAARRRHPSHAGFDLDGEPVVPAPAPQDAPVPVDDRERTVACLARLADARTPLADVRSGPLGTLDVYAFADGTTVCLAPGHRETAERLAAALRGGAAPVLLGGSGVAGGYSLTFAYGEESVYVLADRVIASL